MLEEKRGAVSAYLSCFPGQPYNVRRFWLRGDHKANLSFVYSPFLGHAWSDDLRDEYTLVYETRQGTPFFWTPFVHGIGNTTVLGGPRRGKSLNTNALFTGAMKYGTKTFLFDQGDSYETNVHELGGCSHASRSGVVRVSTSSRCEHSRENVHAIAQIIRLMLNKSGETVDNDDQDAIEKGVERMFDVPRDVRQLKHLSLPPQLTQRVEAMDRGRHLWRDLRQRGRRHAVS